MTNRNDVQPDLPQNHRFDPSPQRREPENKPEAPGGKNEDKAEGDARNKATRTGDR